MQMSQPNNTTTPADGSASQPLSLLPLLTVEKVEANFYRGIATPQGSGRSFGGQVIAQALMSAALTVDPSRLVHSMHGYFIRAGDATQPVLFQVERDRDGGSFTTRRVVAIQHGHPILNLAASFHVAEPGLSHQDPMPDVAPPEDLEPEDQLVTRMADHLSAAHLARLRMPRPVEMRPTALRPPFSRSPRDPVQHLWIRARGPLGDDPVMHRAALAYISDYGLLGTSVLPYGRAYGDADMQFASLDHAVWFHDELRMDEWMLYSMDSPWAGGARGFNRGRLFRRDGTLVANVAQEGLVRQVVARQE
jgi:acyl-CoA thioesterase-2